MTREEAKEFFEDPHVNYNSHSYYTEEEEIEANNWAIFALSENLGEWERVCGGSLIDEYRCSKCKHLPPKKPLTDIKTWGWDFTNFCPNCGADLRK